VFTCYALNATAAVDCPAIQCTAGILVAGSITGFVPNGTHGIHIHAYGNITLSNGESAGGHFNPLLANHACPPTKPRHVGDMGNWVADSTGTVTINFLNDLARFRGVRGIIGGTMIVHSGQDDCVTQPTGNSGLRIAFGVVGRGNFYF